MQRHLLTYLIEDEKKHDRLLGTTRRFQTQHLPVRIGSSHAALQGSQETGNQGSRYGRRGNQPAAAQRTSPRRRLAAAAVPAAPISGAGSPPSPKPKRTAAPTRKPIASRGASSRTAIRFPPYAAGYAPTLARTPATGVRRMAPVAINALERFIGDFGIAQGLKLSRLTSEKRTEGIAVIGAGPAGLSCAYQLARRGYPVTIFEAFSRPGGMLRYGIPKYRLPRERSGCRDSTHPGSRRGRCSATRPSGRTYRSSSCAASTRRCLWASARTAECRLRIPGEDAPNVYTGTEFLNRVNSGEEVRVGGKVLVIGGGDTAIDSARVSKRLGADVTIAVPPVPFRDARHQTGNRRRAGRRRRYPVPDRSSRGPAAKRP